MILLVALVPALLMAWFHPPKPPVINMVTLDAVIAWKTSCIWIDARPQVEFEKDHIPGAMSLNETTWDQQIGAVLASWNAQARLVVYCDERCSASVDVARRLEGMGIQPVFVLKGGWESWKQAHP